MPASDAVFFGHGIVNVNLEWILINEEELLRCKR
jgi:hypothetical protein